ncbi:VOC family protein [Paractinoplanes globisporus]|uniref:VOC family protein n=1 Tax=Paractinoplanes globisporus TaxID=113565 RepID=A0ABW6W634_9ACTN|nr:VOC family protein [Actinoplanes globisporus]
MDEVLSRREASEAVGDDGWRFLLGTLRTAVPTRSMAESAEVAARAVAVCGDDADAHLRADLRADRVVLSLQTLGLAAVTARDTSLAGSISAAVRDLGLHTLPVAGVQLLEIAIDALDIAAIRPFWKALLAYADEPGSDGPEDAIVDPAGEGPAIWFQRMDEPRPQRNRIHFDLCVPHDAAERRIAGAVAAGGHLVSDSRAPAFWILADAEGNEACVTTWQGRDPE